MGGHGGLLCCILHSIVWLYYEPQGSGKRGKQINRVMAEHVLRGGRMLRKSQGGYRC